MRPYEFAPSLFVMIVLALFLTACGGATPPPAAVVVAPTATAVPPTDTPLPPTPTQIPPTATAVPPTNTPVPPTSTSTPIPPTATATAIPPTRTSTSTPTPAPAQPTARPTPQPTVTSKYPLPPGKGGLVVRNYYGGGQADFTINNQTYTLQPSGGEVYIVLDPGRYKWSAHLPGTGTADGAVDIVVDMIRLLQFAE